MRMKMRLLSVGLVSVLAIGLLAGCGSSSASGNASGSSGKVLFTISDTDDTFRASLAEGIMDAADAAGVTVEMKEAGGEIETQIADIEDAVDAGYSGIICQAVDASTALQIEVAAGDLPVVFVNNMPDEDRLEKGSYVYVGSQEEEAGTYQAEYVWEKLGKPSSISLVIMKGEKGHSGTIGRTSAVLNYFSDNNVDVDLVFSDYANWTAENAYLYMEYIEAVGASYDAVICNNDTMALGVVEYLEDNGIDGIPVAGVDATEDGCASIASGGMSFTVLQSASGQGEKAVEVAQALMKGKSIKSIEGASDDQLYVWVDFEPVSASNVSSYQ